MDEKCLLTCYFNYENVSLQLGGEYKCTPKACEDRTPWANGSCSVKEDFAGGGGVAKCAFSRVGDDGVENCVNVGECQSGYPGVCFFFFFFFFLICFFFGCILRRLGAP
jgi:hypothetical protein